VIESKMLSDEEPDNEDFVPASLAAFLEQADQVRRVVSSQLAVNHPSRFFRRGSHLSSNTLICQGFE
jgi:hypothetical protein